MLCASNAMMFNLFIFHLEEYMNTLEVENRKFTPEIVNLKLRYDRENSLQLYVYLDLLLK